MFGYPTGVGVLFGRRPALAKLHRPWFSGGTIEVASVQADRYSLAHGAPAFEDGTLNYTSLPAVEIGLDVLDAVGIDTIHRRVSCLTGWLLARLSDLRHDNGRPLVQVYGPRDLDRRGATVAFNVLDRQGQVIDHDVIEERAAQRKISLRTGCFCNPGAGELALGISREELEGCFRQSGGDMTYEDFRHCIAGKSNGAVRVSLGLASNLADVEAFLAFAEGLRQG
jgi:selenocysteine lyase/cysteine desulfurase